MSTKNNHTADSAWMIAERAKVKSAAEKALGAKMCTEIVV